MPPEKIMLGFGTYGFTYTLASENENKIDSLVSGPGNPGKVKPIIFEFSLNL